MRHPEPTATHYGLVIDGVFHPIPTADMLFCECECREAAESEQGRVVCKACRCPWRPQAKVRRSSAAG